MIKRQYEMFRDQNKIITSLLSSCNFDEFRRTLLLYGQAPAERHRSIKSKFHPKTVTAWPELPSRACLWPPGVT